MKKQWVFVLIVVAISLLFVFKKVVPGNNPSPSPTPVDFIASFEINTLGTKRTFTDPKYHNLTDYVYLSALDPNFVHLKKTGVTWQQFFDTLPMKLTKECLTTGTGQTFCTDTTKKLTFILNHLEDKNALDKEITPGAILLVEYK